MTALLETLQSTAPIGLGFVDRDFRRIVVNEALAELSRPVVEIATGSMVSAEALVRSERPARIHQFGGVHPAG